MKLFEELRKIADKDKLPESHPLSIAALNLSHALSRPKGNKDFSDILLDAESTALAEYAKYTGTPFLSREED